VPQAMGVKGREACTLRRGEDNLGDAGRAQRPMGRSAPDKYGSLGRCLRATAAQVAYDGAAHIDGQRQVLEVRPFPADKEGAGSPLDVVELQLRDFTRP
jgi:hypothetical protein